MAFAKIRRASKVRKESIRAISKKMGVSRNTVRKALRSGEAAPGCRRSVQPRPKLGPFVPALEQMLERNAERPRRERLSLKRIWRLLADQGCDAACRYAAEWRQRQGTGASRAFVPLAFDPGEVCQFDWSREFAVLGGATSKLKVAHLRLRHSRMSCVRAYPRETREMVFDAHNRAFEQFGGSCRRGIYDNMKTAVDAIFAGRDRQFNRRFLEMCSHFLVEPEACAPRAGWEKGRVERQVGDVRERFL